MASVPFPKGYLLSSTPVQSPDDSGYFGSGQRRYKSNANVLSSCSPIKESTLKTVPDVFPSQHEFCDISPQLKFDKNFEHANLIQNDSLSAIEVNELSELEFASSNFSSQNELYKTSSSKTKQKLLSKCYNSSNDTESARFNSLSQDKDIYYKLFESGACDLISSGEFEHSKNSNDESLFLKDKKYVKNFTTFKQTKIDFIHELEIRNCSSIISYILENLSAKELCIASCVSKTWNKVILSDYKANVRRKELITERALSLNGPFKENRLGMRFGPAREHKKAFSNLTNINTVAHLPVNSKVSNTKFDSFIKEAKNGQKLLKCPKCCYASKYLDGNNCICTRCSYRFCCHCLAPILRSHTCFKPQLPNIVVGSRKSKKNLRRL